MASYDFRRSGSWKEIIPQDCAGFGFEYKAHPAAHIEIRFGGCNTVDDPKDQQDVESFFAGGPKMRPLRE